MHERKARKKEAALAMVIPRSVRHVGDLVEAETSESNFMASSRLQAKLYCVEWSEAVGRPISWSDTKFGSQQEKPSSSYRIESQREGSEEEEEEPDVNYYSFRNDEKNVTCSCPLDKCHFFVRWIRKENGFLRVRYQPHCCSDDVVQREWLAKKGSKTAYSAEILAEALTPFLQSGQYKIAMCKAYCRQLLFRPEFVKDSLFRQARDKAWENLYGKPSDEGIILKATVDLLNRKGHSAKLIMVEKEQQLRRLKELYKTLHLKHETLPWNPEEDTEYKQEVDKVEKAEYTHLISGLQVVFKSSREMNVTNAPIFGLDATHCSWKNNQGVLYLICKLDANRKVIILGAQITFANENAEGWKSFLQFAKDNLDLETETSCYVSDRDKGLKKALSLSLSEGLAFYCQWHIIRNLKSISGIRKQDISTFKLATECTTMGKLTELRGRYSEAMEEYMKKNDPRNIYSVENKLNWGKVTTQFVESMNGTIKGKLAQLFTEPLRCHIDFDSIVFFLTHFIAIPPLSPRCSLLQRCALCEKRRRLHNLSYKPRNGTEAEKKERGRTAWSRRIKNQQRLDC